MITIQQMKYFIEAVDTGSLTKAAKNLYLSQPALTKQIAAMEQALGCKLLLRKTSGVKLTEAGRLLYEKAHKLVHLYDQTLQALGRFAEGAALRIGTLPSVASYYLPGLAGGLQAATGRDIRVTVCDTSQELADSLAEREIDAALVQDWEGTPADGWSVTPLFWEPYAALLPRDHPLANREALALGDLLQEQMVLHQAPCDIRSGFRRQVLKSGMEPQIRWELGFNESILSFVAQGHGVSIVPGMAVGHLGDPSLLVKPLTDTDFGRTISLIGRSDLDPAVISYFREQAAVHQQHAG